MIPILSAPNGQVPPPVAASVLTAPSSEPALGRLPMHIVPPPVTNPKVADNRPGQQSVRNVADAPAGKAVTPAYLPRANGEIAFESPYSTTFVAQLFGQFASSDGIGVADGFLDFEQLAQFNMIKYKPSLAFRPRQAEPQAAAEPAMSSSEILMAVDSSVRGGEAVELQDMPVLGSDSAPVPQRQEAVSTPSIFTSGIGAYDATQNRNLAALSTDSRNGGADMTEISFVS